MKRSKTFLTKAAMLLIVALFSLTGARAQQNLPYEYGFENNDLAAEGWTKINQGTTANGNELGIFGVAAQTGSYGFRFSSYFDRNASSYNQYLISPELNVASWGGTVQFSYKVYSSSYPENFKVGYSTTDTNPSSFTFGDEIQTNSTSWTLYEAALPAGTKYVAVFYYSNYAWHLYLDDFSFKEGAIVISGNQEFEESTHVTITCDVEGATILYSTDEGTSWKTYPEGGFVLEETATVTAKATKEGLGDSPEVSKFFVKAGHFTWNLTTNPDDYTITKTADKVEWVSTGATMTLAKGTSSTNANAYLGGTAGHNHTRMYSGQTLTFAPVEGFKITSIEITAPANSGGMFNRRYYGDELNDRMSLTNAATKAHDDYSTQVTITPQNGLSAVVATFSNEVRVTGVNVTYEALPTPFIAIASVDGKVNESSASATNKTLNTYYSNVANGDATPMLCDAQGNTATYDWVSSVSLDGNKNLQYSLTANTTRSERTAYVKVTAGGKSSPVISIIQAAAYVLADGADANNENLILNHRGEKCSVILDGRTFSTGKWYTLCLPFNVTIANSPLAGADARGLDEEGNTRIEGKTLKLEFTEPVEVLDAGSPYIIRWESGDNIVNPAFADVTIVPEMADWQFDLGEGKSVYFKGSYAYQSFTAVDQTTLFISNNKFYYVGNGTTIGAQRGYFKLDGFSYDPSSTSTGVKEFGITFDEEDPTGIEDVNVNLDENESIYNVAGQRLGKMQKGINIVNGKKIFVK